MVQEPEVVHVGRWRRQVGRADGDEELLVVSLAVNLRRPAAMSAVRTRSAELHPPLRGGSVAALHLDVAGEGLSDGRQVGEDLALPVAEALLDHPARPEWLTVAAPDAAAPVPTLLYFPLDVEDLGALNPSPNRACHFFTLSSKSVSL